MYSIKDKTMHSLRGEKTQLFPPIKNFFKETRIFLNGEWKVSSNQTNLNPFKVNQMLLNSFNFIHKLSGVSSWELMLDVRH